MTLSALLEGIPIIKMFQTMYGQMVVTHEITINSIQYDSRKVGRDDVFVAIRGTDHDGHAFIDDAISRGAKVVIVDDDAVRPDSFFMHAGVIKVVVQNTRTALARAAANFYGHPSRKLRLVGVTGTNGKTTTAYLIASVLENAGLIGTIEYKIGSMSIPASHTTPESLELNHLLSRMVENSCSSVVMEVSSHALHQHRVDGLSFASGVFTNLTQDHLDYHGTMENYFRAKKLLFDGLSDRAVAVTNVDDPYGMRIVESTRANVVRYGISPSADIRARDIALSVEGTSFTIVHERKETPVTSPLIGRFNVYNILAAFATGMHLGVPAQDMQKKIAEVRPIRGRLERIVSSKGFTVVIDYAHTPDALRNCLSAIHDIFNDRKTRGRVITVFGCGGNRDRLKRPLMGKIATELSDITIVTSDNPRFEEPEHIIEEILAGTVPTATVYRQVDRKLAIEQALSLAQPGDVVVIAGKGHETYQVIGDRKVHFSDHEVVREIVG